jgi:hypothetical protein
MPAFHRIIQGEYIELQLDSEPQASFQDGSMMLLNATLLGYHPRLSYQVLFEWASDGAAQGDYRLFIHVYDDVNQPPLVQRDLYLNGASMWGYGSQTLGNLLPGSFSDTIGLGQAADLAPGTYQLAIGFYNPQNPQDRLMPESDVYEVSPDGRLWIGKITIDSE